MATTDGLAHRFAGDERGRKFRNRECVGNSDCLSAAGAHCRDAGSVVAQDVVVLRKRRFGLALLALLAATALLVAPQADAADLVVQKPLLVGTKEAPPFALRGEDGVWRGISIELWENIAQDLGVTYEYRQFDLPGLLAATASGEVDVAVAALTITAQREERFDFSHPFHTSGLGIAVAGDQKAGWSRALRRLISPAFLQAVGALVLLLLGIGLLIWLIERKRNPQQFGGSAAQGIASGFWWSAVTMTTVGYGDKAPVTLWGRLLGLVWMFAGIIMISGFTAAIASSLTLTRLEAKVRGAEDLVRVRVVSLPASTSEAYLRRRGISFEPVADLREGLRRVAAGEADALVYDAPMLRYLVQEQYRGRLEVLDGTVERQDYGFAFRQGSALREPVNRTLLEHLHSADWQARLERYLGE